MQGSWDANSTLYFVWFKRTNITNIDIEKYLVSLLQCSLLVLKAVFSHVKYNQILKQLAI